MFEDVGLNEMNVRPQNNITPIYATIATEF